MPGLRPTPSARRPLPRPGKKTTLAAVVGPAVAAALFVSIPADESGRKVRATVDATTGEATIRHVRGRQYLRAYLDIVGVATACDGLTSYRGRKIRKGDVFTEAQCTAMLEEELLRHAEGVMACSPGLALSPTPAVEKPRQGPRFAAVSLAYNVGVGRRAIAGRRKGSGYCGSTAARMFNAGRFTAGCNALLSWNKAGGRVVAGLTKRRQRERAVCLKGV